MYGHLERLLAPLAVQLRHASVVLGKHILGATLHHSADALTRDAVRTGHPARQRLETQTLLLHLHYYYS